jgi:hypothetical protein
VPELYQRLFVNGLLNETFAAQPHAPASVEAGACGWVVNKTGIPD